MTREYFLKKANSVYPNNDFTYVELPEIFTNKIQIKVNCPIHGIFKTIVCNFLNGRGCPECNKIKNTVSCENFIKKATEKYGDTYTYDTSTYKRYTDGKMLIHCNKHNYDFYSIPYRHLLNLKCPYCSKELHEEKHKVLKEKERIENEKNFYNKAIKIHGNKYDYSKVKYVNSKTKVCIICPEHGEFWQEPSNHLCGKGCPKCAGKCTIKDIHELDNMIYIKFGIHYDFSKAVFKNMSTKMTVGFNGKFFNIKPSKLLYPDKNKPILHQRVDNFQSFIEKAILVNNDMYDYSLINEKTYKNTLNEIPIICKKHGIFYIKPESHLQGVGCPICNRSKLEELVNNKLKYLSIKFIEHYKPDFIKDNKYSSKSYDFYLPDYNLLIECQGEQHFHDIKFFGGEKHFKYQVNNDIIKYQKAIENGYNIIYFKNNHTSLNSIISNPIFNNIYNKDNVFSNIEKIVSLLKTNYNG